MFKKIIAAAFISIATYLPVSAQYNTLWIPDTLSGTTFNLNIKDTFRQIVATGQQTITGGINGNFWGPTLFINKGDTVHMHVKNNLNDSTTIHWHGMHFQALIPNVPHWMVVRIK